MGGMVFNAVSPILESKGDVNEKKER